MEHDITKGNTIKINSNTNTYFFKDDNNGISISFFEYTKNTPAPEQYPLHFHNFLELAIITHGRGFHNYNGTIVPVQKGDVLFINNNSGHFLHTNSPPMGKINISFLPKTVYKAACFSLCDNSINELNALDCFISNIVSYSHCLHFSDQSFTRVLTSAMLLVYEYNHFISSGNPRNTIQFNLVLLQLIFLLNIFQLEYRSKFGFNKRDGKVTSLCNYLEKNFKKPVKTSSLADLLGLSEGYLCRKFKTETGQRIKEYLCNLRINYAKELLTYSSLPIWKIAAESGFDDIPYFNRTFKRYTGYAPRAHKACKRKTGE